MSCLKICSSTFEIPYDLQEPGRTADGSGGFTNDSWVSVGTVWCSFKSGSGDEKPRHDRLMTQSLDKVTTYYRADIVSTMRLVNEFGVPYNIRHINDVEMQHQYLILSIETGVDD